MRTATPAARPIDLRRRAGGRAAGRSAGRRPRRPRCRRNCSNSRRTRASIRARRASWSTAWAATCLARWRATTAAARAIKRQARAIFAGGGRDVWNSLAGQRVRAIADSLALPANWRLPDLDAVRDAYQVHRTRQRYPRLAAMAGRSRSAGSRAGCGDLPPHLLGRTANAWRHPTASVGTSATPIR